MEGKLLQSKKSLKLFGAPWLITLISCAIVWVAMAFGVLGTDMGSTLVVMLAIGVPLYELGKRIPIWNTYIGGGILLAFLGTAFLNHFAVIPEKYVKSIDQFTGKGGFLTVFIIILIAGSVLSLDRKTLLKSFVGYFPAILGGVAAAMLLGIVVGAFFGVTPYRIVTHYVLPIMGGGNGGGAVPLSQMYETVTGRSKDEYYNFAIIILTIANIYAILTAAFLNKLGAFYTKLTGDKQTLIRSDVKSEMEEKKEVTPSIADIGAGLLLAFSCYAAGVLLSKKIIPLLFGKSVKIHALACMILLVVILAATGAIPESIRMGAKRLQKFFSSCMTLVIMVGVGVDLSISELVDALTSWGNIIIPLAVVVGAIIGSAVVGYLVGFYPIDSAVTAGLCMANRGGSGDLAVLGAADRMGLMAYAQLSSRLGGAIILIIGSICFSFML